MSRCAILTFTLLAPLLALAAPVVVSHSGYLLDAVDAPVSSPNLSLRLRLVDAPAATGGETIAWEATCPVAVQHGYYAVELGGPACPGDGLDSADLPTGATRWLEVAIAGTVVTPRVRVGPAPVASLAADAEKLGGAAASAYALRADLSTAGTLNLGTNPLEWTKLRNVPATLADGVDDGTTITVANGSGLSLSGTALALATDKASLAKVSGGRLAVSAGDVLSIDAPVITGGTINGATLTNVTGSISGTSATYSGTLDVGAGATANDVRTQLGGSLLLGEPPFVQPYAGNDAQQNRALQLKGSPTAAFGIPSLHLVAGGRSTNRAYNGGIAWMSTDYTSAEKRSAGVFVTLSGTNFDQSTVSILNRPNDAGGLTERLTITPAGNVGIGTTDPKATLDVNGIVKVRVDTASRTSTGDTTPESYKFPGSTGGAPPCTAAERGSIFVGRASAAGNQDSLCACMNIEDVMEWVCFNP